MAEHPARALERAAERLVEDEAIRGPFTDAGFQPLLDWAMQALVTVAECSSDPEGCGAQLKAVLQAAGVAARDRDVTKLVPALRPPLVARRSVLRILSAMPEVRLSDDVDENGRRIAALLQEAL